MFRWLFRMVGMVALAGAFVALVIDGTRSIAANEVLLTRLGEHASQILGAKFATLQPLVERNISPLLWNPVLVWLFATPTPLVLAAIGVVLVLLTRKRAETIGYSARV